MKTGSGSNSTLERVVTEPTAEYLGQRGFSEKGVLQYTEGIVQKKNNSFFRFGN